VDGDPAERIRDYSRAIELAPDFDLAYIYRAELYYYDLADVNAANQDITNALTLKQDHGEARRDLGYFWYNSAGILLDTEAEQNQYRQAELSAREAIAAHQCEGAFVTYNVDCAQDYVLLGRALQAQVKLHESIAAAQQAIAFDPETPFSYEVAAWSYNLLGDRESARPYAEKYLAFGKDDPDVDEDTYEEMRKIAIEP
jgi:tetratricopeptide (TPR) repeat protein